MFHMRVVYFVSAVINAMAQGQLSLAFGRRWDRTRSGPRRFDAGSLVDFVILVENREHNR